MIIIVGAGLSGLLTGYLLKKEGIPFKILEARDRVGGRINTIYRANDTALEMGATWFNDQHRYLKTLLDELDLNYFEQYSEREVFYRPSAQLPAQLVEVPEQTPSYRISGGSSQLIAKLYDSLDEKDILLNQSVREIKTLDHGVQVQAKELFEGDIVVLSLPPKLWAKNIQFAPLLPAALMAIAPNTHTWMEESIKIGLTYSHPFWKEEKLPRTLFSSVGPITELYDHGNQQSSTYALCGFIDPSFKSLSAHKRKDLLIQQLTTTFGASAAKFISYDECLWSLEKNTFVASDDFLFPHENNGNPIFRSSYAKGRVILSSSESSEIHPGYMEGAVHSAIATARKISTDLRSI